MSIAQWNEYPGHGHWVRNTTHFPGGISLHLWELFIPAHHEGTKIGFRRYGCAIERFDFARFRGRIYVRLSPVQDARELAARCTTAEEAVATKLWRRDRDAWQKIEASLRNRLLEFGRQPTSDWNPKAYLERLRALRQIFVDGVIQHFSQQPASMFAVGSWVRDTCSWTGAGTSETLSVLRNSSGESAEYVRAITRLAEKIDGSSTGSVLLRDQTMEASTRLERLRSVSAEIRDGIDACLDEYGDRIVTGFDLTDLTLRELPHFTLAVLIAPTAAAGNGEPGSTRLEVEEKLRARVPPESRAAFEEGLQEAKCAYGLNDEDVRMTYLWPLGLLRRAMLVVADQLVARGRLHSRDDIFQTTPLELDNLLCGNCSPSSDELSRRTEEWRTWALEEPPASFGDPEILVPKDLHGPACARVTSAIRFYLAEMDGRAQTSPQSSWSLLIEGLAASPGRYEGKARVVRGPGDFERVSHGDVLVARTTSPAYNVILPIIGGVVTDRGGALCHAAIVAREFGIPAVVGTSLATIKIPDGAHVLVDGDRGFVTVRV
jgi:rifampicin phosphotransferase